MAEIESKTEITSISTKEEEKKNQSPVFTIFQNFRLEIPQFGQSKQKSSNTTQTIETVEKEEETGIGFVTFRDSRPDISSLKLSVENEQGESSNHIWHVYALGGLLIARWMWARWNEAKANKPGNPPSGNEEPDHTED